MNWPPGCAPWCAVPTAGETRLSAGAVELDPAAHQVWLAGVPVELSGREYDLLHALLLSNGRVLSREQLEQRLYQWGSEINSNAVEVHIYHLRRKLGAGLIETVRGVGYRMAQGATRMSAASERRCGPPHRQPGPHTALFANPALW